jgi:uncharacterized tellurite resistance protein B-like protein
MTSFFEHQKSSYKKNYLRNLIALASSDGNLDEDEKALIVKIGVRRGLKERQSIQLIQDFEQNPQPVFLPENIHNRMNMLYDLMQVIYADNFVSHSEIDFLLNIVESFGLPADIVVEMINLFDEGTPDSLRWREFVEHITAQKELK